MVATSNSRMHDRLVSHGVKAKSTKLKDPARSFQAIYHKIRFMAIVGVRPDTVDAYYAGTASRMGNVPISVRVAT